MHIHQSHKSTFDWVSILLYVLLVGIGWLNIYSASFSEIQTAFFDFQQIHTKQLVWIALSGLLIVFVLNIDAKFYERFSSIIYLLSVVSLIGLFVFGKTISGQTAWYAFGNFSIQPAEFAKIATALALGKYLGDIQTDINYFTHQLKAFLIIGIPVLLIFLQPDPGSALVFFAFIFPLFREGLYFIYLMLGFLAVFLFVNTLAFGLVWVIAGIIIIAVFLFFKNRKKRPSITKYVLITLLS